MYRIIETFATVILLLLLMMFVLHMIRGDAADWLTSKFRVGESFTKTKGATSLPNQPGGDETLIIRPPTGQIS